MENKTAVAYIQEFGRFVDMPTFERMSALMKALEEPEKQLKYIHIAGTNGKGSTAAMLSSVLSQAGYCTGLYTSPYIFDFTERMQINGTPIKIEELEALVEEAKPKIEKLQQEGFKFTTFDITTALAWMWFAKKKCDVVVLETGIGGRTDSTNIIPKPLVSVLTSISLDHTEFLGDSVESIAKEKSGIIKALGHTVVYPIQELEALNEIQKECKIKDNTLHLVDQTNCCLKSLDLEGTEFVYKENPYRINLIGQHQIYNAATVLEALEVLQKEYGYEIGEVAIQKGLEKTYWPGRIEVVAKCPPIVVDGAHNVSAIARLIETLKPLHKGRVLIIFGMMADKDYRTVLSQLVSYGDQIILVKPEGVRGLDPVTCTRELERLCTLEEKQLGRNVVFQVIPQLEKALQEGLKLQNQSSEETLLLVCGSLYMVPNALSFFRKK